MEDQPNYVNLNVADGSRMAAYVAKPVSSIRSPAIIVFQEAFGVNHHIQQVTERFANQGYVAIAPELFHRTAPQGFTVSYGEYNTVMPHTKALTNEGLEADIKATYQWLVEQDIIDQSRIFSIGYCMGGRVSFLANAVLPLKAAVSYYGGGMDSLAGKAPHLHGRHLFYWGGLDKHIKPENIDAVIKAIEAAGKDYVNVKISYADHGFNCNERPSYNEAASKEAWALTLAFLQNN